MTDESKTDTPTNGELVAADPRREAKSALDRPDVDLVTHSPFTSMHAFVTAQRMAGMLASSSVIPDDYRTHVWNKDTNQWEENPSAIGNCFIAIELANRLNTSALTVMQNVDMIHGRPALRGKMLIGLVNASGQFAHNLRFECNDEPGDKYGYRAWTTSKEGDRLEGPWITWELVKKEGWHSKRGSKWMTIPELMFQYRAASWWSALHAPHITLGLYESEEARDIGEADQSTRAALLESKLAEADEQEKIRATVTAAKEAKAEEMDAEEGPRADKPDPDPPKKRGTRRKVKKAEDEPKQGAKPEQETKQEPTPPADEPPADEPAKPKQDDNGYSDFNLE